MGQRLVITIRNSCGEMLATQYMHWSAYSGCTLRCAEQIYEVLQNSNVREETEYAVDLLRKAFPGAALTEDAAAALGVKETRTLDRNAGLIDITLDQMEESMGWAEGNLEIYLLNENQDPDLMEINMNVMYTEELEDYANEHGDEIMVCTEPDGKKKIFKKEGESWKPVKCYELDFHGWASNFHELWKLNELHASAVGDYEVFCVYKGVKEDDYFVIGWIE